jgi:UDP-3-O-[3-hydroxymyristoyl] glucosamine N-acyltransferase
VALRLYCAEGESYEEGDPTSTMAMKTSQEQNSPKSFSLEEVAHLTGTRIKGNPQIRVYGIGSVENATPDQLSFISDERYLPLIADCQAAVLIVPLSLEDLDRPLLISPRPYLAMARAAQLFSSPPYLPAGIHETASIGEEAHPGDCVRVGPLAQIGCRTRLGDRTRVYGGAHLGCDVEVGEDCLIYPGVTILDRCRIGNRVIIHSGTVVGSDGFGFAQDELGHHIKIPQTGIVQIDDDVEIGANCTIDRAAYGRTWIQRGTKIDNLVQIAHNVVIGEHSILIAQVGVSGSTRLGRHVVLAGQVGVVGHIEIGDGVRVGAQSGVGRSVKAGEDVSGSPVMPHKEWLKMTVNVKRLPQLKAELRQLKMKVRELEKAIHGE